MDYEEGCEPAFKVGQKVKSFNFGNEVLKIEVHSSIVLRGI